MKKNVIFALMALAVIGTVVAVGSISTGKTITSTDSAGADNGAYWTYGTAPNLHWMVYADHEIVTFYTVPANTKLQIDDVVMTNVNGTYRTRAELVAGTTGTQDTIYVILPPYGNFGLSNTRIVLNSGEMVRAYCPAGNCYFSVSGHLI